MPEMRFRLQAGEPKDLSISWELSFSWRLWTWKNLRVRYRGKSLGPPIPSAKELEGNCDYTLPDGSTLQVCLKDGFGGPTPIVTRNGIPLPGSHSDPRMAVQRAKVALIVIGGMSFASGLLRETGLLQLQESSGWPQMAFGALFGVFAWLVAGRRSRLALLLAMGLLALDTVEWLVGLCQPGVLSAGNQTPWIALFIRLLFLLLLVQGFRAMGRADAADRRDRAVEAFR